MNVIEEMATVWRALASNKLRSALTLLGVIMGVGTIVVLASVMQGGLAAIARSVDQASGEDLINVSVLRRNASGSVQAPLNTGDIGALSRASGLASATIEPQVDEEVDVAAPGGRTMRARVVGANPGTLAFYQLEMGAGRFIVDLDRSEERRVAVIGRDLARTLFFGGATSWDWPTALGKDLYVHGDRFRVVGVLSTKPSLNVGNQTWNNAVIVPDTTFMAERGRADVDAILVRVNEVPPPAEKLVRADRTIRGVLQGRNHPGGSLQVGDTLREGGQERGFLQALQILLWAVAVICLGVGGINIMNIMLVTVTERTREIGLRLALGARARDIRRQFIFEAAAISALGGLIGVGGGILLAWAISRGLGSWLGYWPFMVDPKAVVVAFASALGTGVAFGYYPADKAAKLQPIECLRYE